MNKVKILNKDHHPFINSHKNGFLLLFIQAKHWFINYNYLFCIKVSIVVNIYMSVLCTKTNYKN